MPGSGGAGAPGGGRVPAKILLANRDDLRRAGRSLDEPSFHVGIMFERALDAAGFEPELMAPADPRRILRAGIDFLGPVRRAPVAAVVQGYACVSAFLDSLLPRPSAVILHTWKVPWTGPRRLTAHLMDRVLERVIRISRLVVLASHEQRRLMAERHPRVRTVWIPVTADIDWWKPGPIETGVLDRLRLRRGEYLLSVGDVDRDESVPVRVAQRLSRPLVRVTRDPGTKARAEETFRSLDARNAHCLLRIPYPELRDLYRGAWTMLAAPVLSYHPAGLTGLTEGMAAGTPLLFPRSVTAEGYAEDGVHALLYDEMSVDSIAAAAARLEEPGLRARISQSARAVSEQRLNYDAASAMLREAIVGLDLHATPRARRWLRRHSPAEAEKR